MIVAIDPGLTGAIAVMDSQTGIFLNVHDMPVQEKLRGKGKMVDVRRLAAIFRGLRAGTSFVIEDVHAMPGQGVSSMFSFGRSLGAIEGCAASVNGAINYVAPAQWKKKLKLSGKDKDACRTLMRNLYPDWELNLSRKKDVGRADAMAIAHWYCTTTR